MNYMTHMDLFGMQPINHLALSFLRPVKWLLQICKALYDQYGSVWDAALRFIWHSATYSL